MFIIYLNKWCIRYGLDNRGVFVRFPARPWDISLPQSIQAGSAAQPGSYPKSIGDYFFRVKTAGM